MEKNILINLYITSTKSHEPDMVCEFVQSHMNHEDLEISSYGRLLDVINIYLKKASVTWSRSSI